LASRRSIARTVRPNAPATRRCFRIPGRYSVPCRATERSASAAVRHAASMRVVPVVDYRAETLARHPDLSSQCCCYVHIQRHCDSHCLTFLFLSPRNAHPTPPKPHPAAGPSSTTSSARQSPTPDCAPPPRFGSAPRPSGFSAAPGPPARESRPTCQPVPEPRGSRGVGPSRRTVVPLPRYILRQRLTAKKAPQPLISCVSHQTFQPLPDRVRIGGSPQAARASSSNASSR
jgi:hypothetical protein